MVNQVNVQFNLLLDRAKTSCFSNLTLFNHSAVIATLHDRNAIIFQAHFLMCGSERMTLTNTILSDCFFKETDHSTTPI